MRINFTSVTPYKYKETASKNSPVRIVTPPPTQKSSGDFFVRSSHRSIKMKTNIDSINKYSYSDENYIKQEEFDELFYNKNVDDNDFREILIKHLCFLLMERCKELGIVNNPVFRGEFSDMNPKETVHEIFILERTKHSQDACIKIDWTEEYNELMEVLSEDRFENKEEIENILIKQTWLKPTQEV